MKSISLLTSALTAALVSTSAFATQSNHLIPRTGCFATNSSEMPYLYIQKNSVSYGMTTMIAGKIARIHGKTGSVYYTQDDRKKVSVSFEADYQTSAFRFTRVQTAHESLMDAADGYTLTSTQTSDRATGAPITSALSIAYSPFESRPVITMNASITGQDKFSSLLVFNSDSKKIEARLMERLPEAVCEKAGL